MSRSEFQLIEAFLRAFPRPSGGLVLGPGDDAALLRPPPGRALAVTVDALVEDVHFTSDFSSAEVGHKALAVNLSDLAAMGAQPLWFFCAVELPPSRAGEVPALARGMSALARAHGCQLAGGNFTRGPHLALTITAVGAVAPGRALRRGGARAGDRLFVSGSLGGAAAGLAAGAPAACRARQRRPQPRVALGLASLGLARAAIDVSDGLLQDLGHLLRASGLAAEVDAARLPVQRGASLQQALSGGEDYELILAVPPRRAAALQAAAARVGTALTEIGRVSAGPPGRVALAHAPEGLSAAGHDHFAGRPPGTGD